MAQGCGMLAFLIGSLACAVLAATAAAAESTGTPAGYTAWCWGRGDSGELGNGQRQNSSVPVPVAGNHSFVALNANQEVTCGVDSSGRGWCWGDGEDGYLANGEFDTYDVPVPVQGDHTFVDISPPCALDSAGRAWCWGEGWRGHLGDGKNYSYGTIEFSIPVAVAGGHKFAKLGHACGLEATGTARCWGYARHGGLGTGTLWEASPTPLWGNHTIAYLGQDGALDNEGQSWVWGSSFQGELGYDGGGSNIPLHFPKDHKFVAISLPCGLEATGQAWCWGDGNRGQLGNGVGKSLTGGSAGEFYDLNSTTPVAVAGGHTFVSIHSAGSFNCALDRTGQAWCWGSGENGRLGNGKTKDAAAPTRVAGNHTFVALSLGYEHACGLAVDALAEPLQVPKLPSLPLEVPMLPVPRGLGILQPSSPPAVTEQPALSPPLPPPPSPSPSPSPTQASSSAAPIGAIVGGTVAGVGIAAVLAYFALRPGKGWLRASQGRAAFPPSSSSTGLLPTSGKFPSTPLLEGCDTFLLESDPTLSYIASSLASARAAAAAVGSSGHGALRSEVRQWEVCWEEITPQRAIGRGSYGTVYLCRWNETAVACKILIGLDDTSQRRLALPAAAADRLQAEAGIMARMRHPNIVSFLGLCALPPCILTEYCSQGSLCDVLRAACTDSAKAAGMTWQLRLRMALDAATGMLYLHRMKPPIIHRDLKSPNLLVDEHYRTKVCDFNLSRLLDEARQQSTGSAAANNPIWLAPEVLQGHPATAASDVYSFGLVLWEVLSWQLPWARTPPFEVWRKVVNGERPPVPALSELPGPDTHAFSGLGAYLQLMRECWAQDPNVRPTFADIVPRLRELLG